MTVSTGSLYAVKVLHGAPGDSHTAIETYLVANSEEEVAEWINANKCYGDWFESEYDDEPRTRYADDDCTVEISFREWVLKNKGDLKDDEGWEDAYYGVTKWGWEKVEASAADIEATIRMGISIQANTKEAN